MGTMFVLPVHGCNVLAYFGREVCELLGMPPIHGPSRFGRFAEGLIHHVIADFLELEFRTFEHVGSNSSGIDEECRDGGFHVAGDAIVNAFPGTADNGVDECRVSGHSPFLSPSAVSSSRLAHSSGLSGSPPMVFGRRFRPLPGSDCMLLSMRMTSALICSCKPLVQVAWTLKFGSMQDVVDLNVFYSFAHLEHFVSVHDFSRVIVATFMDAWCGLVPHGPGSTPVGATVCLPEPKGTRRTRSIGAFISVMQLSLPPVGFSRSRIEEMVTSHHVGDLLCSWSFSILAT